jgi:hypothetical protein
MGQSSAGRVAAIHCWLSALTGEIGANDQAAD